MTYGSSNQDKGSTRSQQQQILTASLAVKRKNSQSNFSRKLAVKNFFFLLCCFLTLIFSNISQSPKFFTIYDLALDHQDMINCLLLLHNYLKMEDEKVFEDLLYFFKIWYIIYRILTV